jgi:hypothetical protein
VAVCELIPERGGIGYQPTVSSPRMIKSLSALAIFAVLGALVVALPGFAPQVEAHEPVALAKAGPLDIQPLVRNCSQQVWPNFDTSCLRNGQSGALIQEAARLVTVPVK